MVLIVFSMYSSLQEEKLAVLSIFLPLLFADNALLRLAVVRFFIRFQAEGGESNGES